MLLFGMDIPLVEILLVMGIISIIILVEIIVILILVLQAFKKAKSKE